MNLRTTDVFKNLANNKSSKLIILNEKQLKSLQQWHT